MWRGYWIETWETKRRKRENIFQGSAIKIERAEGSRLFLPLWFHRYFVTLITVGANLFLLAGFPAGLWLLGYQGHDVDQAPLLAEVRKGEVSMTCCSCQQISFTQDRWNDKGHHWPQQLRTSAIPGQPRPASGPPMCKRKKVPHSALHEWSTAACAAYLLPCTRSAGGAKSIPALAGGLAAGSSTPWRGERWLNDWTAASQSPG